MSLVKGKKGLIMGVANERSIAWGISQKLSEAGAELAFTYLGDALKKRVIPLAKSLNSDFPTSSISTFLFKKEWSELHLYKNFASPIADAAKVLIGPALIAFTLIPFDPRSLARYLTLASRADLQTPITL